MPTRHAPCAKQLSAGSYARYAAAAWLSTAILLSVSPAVGAIRCSMVSLFCCKTAHYDRTLIQRYNGANPGAIQ